MTSISLKTINFESSKEEKPQSFDVANSLDAISPKSVAFIVRWQLAARRSGSAKTKTMAEISGTTAKPWKQKGTGRARQGSRRSVQFVGGRTCHGPMPRSFDFAAPKQIVQLALTDVLKTKLKENKVVLFSEISADKIKTKNVNEALEFSKISSALILLDQTTKNSAALVKSARNIKHVKVLDAKAINVYDLLRFDNVIVDSKIFENKILGIL